MEALRLAIGPASRDSSISSSSLTTPSIPSLSSWSSMSSLPSWPSMSSISSSTTIETTTNSANTTFDAGDLTEDLTDVDAATEPESNASNRIIIDASEISRQKEGASSNSSLHPPKQHPLASVQRGGNDGARPKEGLGKNTRANKNKKTRKAKALEDAENEKKENEELRLKLEEAEAVRRALEESREEERQKQRDLQEEMKIKEAEALKIKKEAEKVELEAKEKVKKAEREKAKGNKKGMTYEQVEWLKKEIPKLDRANNDWGNKWENNPTIPFSPEDIQDLKDTAIFARAVPDPCELCIGAKKVEGEIKSKVENLQLRIDMRMSEVKKMNRELVEKRFELSEHNKRKCTDCSNCKDENKPKRQKINHSNPFPQTNRQTLAADAVQDSNAERREEKDGTSGKAKTDPDAPPNTQPDEDAASGTTRGGVEGGEWNSNRSRGALRSYRGKARGNSNGNYDIKFSKGGFQPNIFYCYRCGTEGHIARNCPQPDPRKLARKDREEKKENETETRENKEERNKVKARLGPKPKPSHNDLYNEMEIAKPNPTKLSGFKIPKISNKDRRFQIQNRASGSQPEEEASRISNAEAETAEKEDENDDENAEGNDTDDFQINLSDRERRELDD